VNVYKTEAQRQTLERILAVIRKIYAEEPQEIDPLRNDNAPGALPPQADVEIG